MDVTKPRHPRRARAADAVRAVDATLVFASPAALRNVVATADALDAGTATTWPGAAALCAGAPVPAALLAAVVDLLPKAEAHTPYGMTEVLPVTDIALDELDAGAGRPARACASGGPCPGRRCASRRSTRRRAHR